uniref:Uncharacterized protein n=1 Tax=Thermocrinis ruber TaxID=75906 RepID=A0A7C5WZ80_9AQUI
MADFISLHPEEWIALVSGLRFSAAAAQAKPIFIPVVILVIGLSLLIWLYRLERDREWNAFILWLIFSSAIILSSFRTQRVVVELNPIVLNSNSMMLQVKKDEVKVDKEKQTLYYDPEASGISALLAIPDKIASLMFNFMDVNLLSKLTGQAKTVPLDNIACKDPRYVAGLVQMLTLDWALGASARKDEEVEDIDPRIRAFEECYRNGFEGDIPFSSNRKLTIQLGLKDSAEAVGRGLLTTLVAAPIIAFLLLVEAPLVALGVGIAAFFGGFMTKMYDLIKEQDGGAVVDCTKFIDAFREAAVNIADQCEKALGVKYDNKDVFVSAAMVCLINPDKIPDVYSHTKQDCSKLRDKTLSALETAKQAMDKQMNIRSDTPIKNFFAGVVSEVKSWWFSLTYMDYPLKFDLLAKGQGIVLALLTAGFPFIAVLSVIPTGRHFINWPLLLNYMIGYFLVKMWIPILFFIVNVATHNLAKITGW